MEIHLSYLRNGTTIHSIIPVWMPLTDGQTIDLRIQMADGSDGLARLWHLLDVETRQQLAALARVDDDCKL